MTHYIPYEELPDFYIAAVIAAEDQRFESHPGIDPIAIVRAVWTDLKAGALVEGGSTITQQLAKNLYFTQEKKFERKFAEFIPAFPFERECSKQEIFALYVNTIYFGSGYYGIDAAAEGYFQKTPAELNDWECAMLAGLPNAPSAYALDAHPDLARQRLNQVVESMLEDGAISQTEAEALFEQGQS